MQRRKQMLTEAQIIEALHEERITLEEAREFLRVLEERGA
jgi:hypothetical protein